MNSKKKLEVIKKVLYADPHYNLNSNIIILIKYIATVIQSDYNRYSLIIGLTMFSYEKILKKKDSIDVQVALDIILTTPHLNWDEPEIGYTKYVSYALDRELDKISPIEWAKLLNFSYSHISPSVTNLD